MESLAPATVRLHSLAYPVTALGPGRRLVLWVAGCDLACPGCVSPELQDPASGREVPLQRLLQRLLQLPEALDGVSLSGGEPFQQAAALAALLESLRVARPEWNVLVFSGYPLRRLHAQGAAARALLARTDVLVAGPYQARRPASRHPLAASSGQRVHYLSERGQRLRAACEALPLDAANLGQGDGPAQRLIGIIRPPQRARLHRQLGLVSGAPPVAPGELKHA